MYGLESFVRFGHSVLLYKINKAIEFIASFTMEVEMDNI